MKKEKFDLLMDKNKLVHIVKKNEILYSFNNISKEIAIFLQETIIKYNKDYKVFSIDYLIKFILRELLEAWDTEISKLVKEWRISPVGTDAKAFIDKSKQIQKNRDDFLKKFTKEDQEYYLKIQREKSDELFETAKKRMNENCKENTKNVTIYIKEFKKFLDMNKIKYEFKEKYCVWSKDNTQNDSFLFDNPEMKMKVAVAVDYLNWRIHLNRLFNDWHYANLYWFADENDTSTKINIENSEVQFKSLMNYINRLWKVG